MSRASASSIAGGDAIDEPLGEGRVERVIRFIRERFFAGRTFMGLADLNAQAGEFCRGVALARDWPEDKRRTVGAALEEERALLLPLPSEPFPCAEQVAARAGKTPYVRFDRNDYSVPQSTCISPASAARAT